MDDAEEWDEEGFDGGGVDPVGDGIPAGNGINGGGGQSRLGLEALRLAIHRPDEVAHRLEAALFTDELQRAAFVTLVDADDLHQAIDSSPPQVRALLVRLTVEEPISDAAGVVAQLVRQATLREIVEVEREARRSKLANGEVAKVRVWLQELDDPAGAAAATDRLVAWLAGRGQACV
jgi:hypothetical protein